MLRRPNIKRRLSSVVRWGGSVVTGILLVLYFLNMPFYSGSALPLNCEWRMEHGRLKIERSSGGSTENFYIAGNAEGLRFSPEGNFSGLSDWMINIPLWVAVLAIGGLTVRSWIVYRRNKPLFKTGCPTCGYDTSDNQGKKCPECGGESRSNPIRS